MKLLAKYQNGNLTTSIYDDGTRIRETEDDNFNPSFAENVDVHTSNRCNNGCKFCYANCTLDGKFGKLSGWHFLETLHPGTEMALNLNFPMPPDFFDLLRYLKSQGIITNVTINQNHFDIREDIIQQMYDEELIHGLGVSLTNPFRDFVERIQKYPNAVIHVINGIFSEHDYQILKDSNLKVLILGYKDVGRGVDYHDKEDASITNNHKWLYDNLKEVSKHFKVISFDNLALEQLEVRRLLTDEQWEEFYGGDDGTFSYYINLVDGYFAKNSLSPVHYPIGDLSMDEMFNIIKEMGMVKIVECEWADWCPRDCKNKHIMRIIQKNGFNTYVIEQPIEENLGNCDYYRIHSNDAFIKK